jgi:GT2 family glycosyltransferase
MNSMDIPVITVVVSTRNRGDSIVKTVETILSSDYSQFELRVIDQSEDESTEASLLPFVKNPHLQYLRTVSKGVSTGRNLGINSTQNELIAVTDDDCEIPRGWLKGLAAAFSVDPRIGVIFGNVLPGPHDPSAGFIPSYVRKDPFLARSIYEKNRVEGMSACMGLRRSVWQRLGGFDGRLGPGTPFRAAEEADFTIRTLLAGYFVYETPNVAIIHHGFRTWKQGLTLIHGYWYATGAMFAKHIKCGHWPVVLLLMRLGLRWLVGGSQVTASLGKNPQRWLRLISFIKGFGAGSFTPTDKKKCQFT